MPLDDASDVLAAFAGELYEATLSRPPTTAYDENDATGGPSGSPTEYECEGIAFNYEQRDVDGTRIVKGDYRVVLLRGSLAIVPRPGDSISIPPPGTQTAVSARVISIEAVTSAQITMQVRGGVA